MLRSKPVSTRPVSAATRIDAVSDQVRTIDLGAATWTFQSQSSEGPWASEWLPARVSGCVHTDLRAQGLIEDPFHGCNELDLQWIERVNWQYRCDFELAPDGYEHEALELVLDGLDMINAKALPDPQRQQEYLKLFAEAIPQALREFDRLTPYLQASPALPLPGCHTQTMLPSHDAHDWEVWHACKPVEHYEGTRHRFVSEFGMQSYPSLPVALRFCPPEQLDIGSPVFQNHQKDTGGNATILDYTLRLYRPQGDYGGLAYLSQLNQAWCTKVAVEHFRRSQPYTLGALISQLNDCWPVASWSSLEFGGRWKALHYAARRFFAPALASARHLGSETNTIGNYTANSKGEFELWTSFDAPEPRKARLQWTLFTLAGERRLEGAMPVQLRPLESVLQSTLDCTAELAGLGRDKAVLQLRPMPDQGLTPLSENTMFFCAPRMMTLEPASITVNQQAAGPGRWDLSISSTQFEHGVSLEFEQASVTLSDNAFELFPGEVHLLRVSTAAAETLKLPPFLLRSANPNQVSL